MTFRDGEWGTLESGFELEIVEGANQVEMSSLGVSCFMKVEPSAI